MQISIAHGKRNIFAFFQYITRIQKTEMISQLRW